MVQMALVALKRFSSESVGLLPNVVSLLIAGLGNHSRQVLRACILARESLVASGLMRCSELAEK